MNNRIISTERIFSGRIINLRVDQVELPDGSRASREIIEHPGAAAIVPVDAEGRVHMVRQYRDAVGERLLEIPAGKLKPGEEPAACARRELKEELGFETGRVEHLATFYSTPGFCDEVMHLFLAEDLSRKAGEADTEEFIEAEVRDLDAVEELVGEIRDAKSIAGILMASMIMGRRGKKGG